MRVSFVLSLLFLLQTRCMCILQSFPVRIYCWSLRCDLYRTVCAIVLSTVRRFNRIKPRFISLPNRPGFALMDPSSVARSVASALANPYSLSNLQPPRHHVNSQGYTYSSSYNPSSHPSISYSSPIPSFSNAPSASTSRNLPPRGNPPTHWYTHGNSKCTHSGCMFTGSANSVQIHMMDRHLIYPPGWHARKRQTDWDTDPSLKGYVLVHTQPGRAT